MSELVRVAQGGRWAYVPRDSSQHRMICRLAKDGLASIGGPEVRLHSDAGPIFWESLGPESTGEAVEPPTRALESLSERAIDVQPDERLCIGRAQSAISYNEFADVSVLHGMSHGKGLPITSHCLSDGEIVLAAWPGADAKKRLVPGIVRADGRRLSLELAEAAPHGERCFVLDEHGTELCTVSMRSDGSDVIRILSPKAIDSWLFSVNSTASRAKSSRFEVEASGGRGFLILDKKTGRRYAGNLRSGPEEQERWTMEGERLEWLLASRGLGGVLPIYELEKA